MKKIAYLLVITAAIGICSCRTTEANYRAAYEAAREKQTETGDSLTTAMLRQSQEPQMMSFNENGKRYTFGVLTMPVAKKVDAGNAEGLRRFSVCVGRFKQVFNAKSLCERLVADGYAEACVVHDRQNYYYVIATSTTSPAQAQELLDQVKSDKRLSFQKSFPYILRPSHLVR